MVFGAGSGRVGNINKFVLQMPLCSNMGSHCWRAIALAGVMATGDVRHAALPGIVGLWLRYFTRYENIGPGRDGRFKITLRPTLHHAIFLSSCVRISDKGHGSIQLHFQSLGQRLRVGETVVRLVLSNKPQVLLPKTLSRRQTQLQTELGVVSQFRMGIQR